MLDLEIIGEGATTKIYRDGDKAIKLYVNAPPNEAENEAWLQSYAVKMGLPVPSVYGVRKIDDSLTALDMDYISGKPLMHEKMNPSERQKVIQTMVKLQCSVHSVNADGLPKQSDKIKWKIERNNYIDKAVKDNLLSLLNNLNAQSNNLCHGDFHPLNIMFDGKKHWIIDWVDASAGSPLADACRTYLIFKQFLIRLSGVYLRCFCKESGAAQNDILSWLPVIAAARMSENMDNKARLPLMKIVDEWGAVSL
jgi:aminoglycoside phosphotransferase (APT) family kinase protein